MKLPKEFFLRDDVVQISKELLGKYLFTKIDGILTGGIIVETEAYRAPEDKASHAFNNKKTPRTEVFYEEGGIAYVYLCYGIHSLFNIVTNKKDIPHAILIRAIEPKVGIETILERRKQDSLKYNISSGPGSTSVALGINRIHNKENLSGNTIWLEDRGVKIAEKEIIKSSRVGVDYAEEWANKPWRFRIKDNPWAGK